MEPTATILDIKSLFHKSCKFIHQIIDFIVSQILDAHLPDVKVMFVSDRSKMVSSQTVPAFGPKYVLMVLVQQPADLCQTVCVVV